MPPRRRPALAAEAERRLRERLTRIGGDAKVIRKRRAWTQAELSNRAGLGRMVIGRLERGVGPLELETLERVGLALGVPVVAGLGRDPQLEVADAAHLAMQELVLRHARAFGFSGQFELPTRPAEPWRSIDVAIGSDARHHMICVECWNSIGDIGAAARASARKAAELEQMAIARWGEDSKVGLVWVVRSTRRNRGLVARYPEVFGARFPGSSRGWVAALTTGSEPPAETGLVWCDLSATRLFAWRRGIPTGSGS
jgi:transcriptional regulator with XRE-family HTH domain